MNHFQHLTLEQADWLLGCIRGWGLDCAREYAQLRFGLDGSEFRGFVERNQRAVAGALNAHARRAG